MCFKAEATWHPFGSSSNAWSRWDQGLQPWSASQFLCSFSCEFTESCGDTESYCWWWTIHERPEICSGREKRCWASETSSQPLSHKYHEAFTWRMNETVWHPFGKEFACQHFIGVFLRLQARASCFQLSRFSANSDVKNMQQERCIKFCITFQQCQTHCTKVRCEMWPKVSVAQRMPCLLSPIES